MRINANIRSLGLILLFGYLAFIPTGPFPIFIGFGLKLDILLGVLLLFFLFFYTLRVSEWPNYLLLAWSFYMFAVVVSTIFSEQLYTSLGYMLITLAYSLVTLLAPIVFWDKSNSIRKWIFLAASITGLLICFLYFVFDFAHSHRFALSLHDVSATGHGSKEGIAAVDPNMTAAGLAFALIAYFPLLFKKRSLVLFELLGSAFILGGIIITISRSAFVGLLGAIVFASFIVLIKWLLFHPLILKRGLIWYLALFFLVLLVFIFAGYTFFPDMITNLVYRLEHSGADEARLMLLKEAWGVFFSTPKHLLIGNGFMTTNPHNEFMRTLSTMGVFGVLSSIAFLLSLFYCVLGKTFHDNRSFFSALSLILFILTITLFYGYTKLLWVAWMFLLFLYQDSLIERGNSY